MPAARRSSSTSSARWPRSPRRSGPRWCSVSHNDLTHEEAAYVLGCPVGTVKTHVLRGKQRLKAALADYAP